MKQLFFILIIFCAFSVSAQVKAPKGFDIGGTIIDANEVKALNGITGNIKDTLDSKVSNADLGAATGEFYTKAQTDSIAALKASLSSPTFTGTPLVPTAAAGTNTTQAASTAYVTEAVEGSSLFVQLANSNGSSILGITSGASGLSATPLALASQRLYLIPVQIQKTGTCHGVKFMLGTAGDFTDSGFNGVALFTESNGTYTQVRTSANSGNGWKTTANTQASIDFTSTINVTIGEIYYVGILYSSSAQTTAPSIVCATVWTNATFSINTLMGFTNSRKYFQYLGSQASMPLSLSASATTSANSIPFAILY